MAWHRAVGTCQKWLHFGKGQLAWCALWPCTTQPLGCCRCCFVLLLKQFYLSQQIITLLLLHLHATAATKQHQYSCCVMFPMLSAQLSSEWTYSQLGLSDIAGA